VAFEISLVCYPAVIDETLRTRKILSFTIQAYQLDLTPAQIRDKIRRDFEEQRSITDLAVVDVLVFKGKAELEDTLRIFKTKSHVMRLLVPNDTKQDTLPRDTDLLKRFYAGHEL